MATVSAHPQTLPGALRLLADPTRLRILALLEREELAVGELCRAVDLAQSRVSNHLRLLREGGLLRERRVGTSTYLRLAAPADGDQGPVGGRLWPTLRAELAELPEHAADRVRLTAVLAERREKDGDFFDRVAGEWDKVGGAFETGRSRERAAVHLLPRGLTFADLGCGTGYMAEALLDTADRLICVDRSDAMLTEAEKRLGRRGSRTRIEFRQGRLDALPIEDGELDGLVCGLVLHHLEELDDAVREMARVLRPGGTASVLELAPHKEAWMRHELGDLHLGVDATDALAAMERAGFEDLVLEPAEDHYCPRRLDSGPDDATVRLSLYVVRGRRPLSQDVPAQA